MSVLSSHLCSSEPQNIAADVHVCRCCLATDIKLYDLDEKHLGELYNEFIGNFIVSKDYLPYTACEICLQLLRKFGTFRRRCRIAKETLLQLYLENKLSTDNMKLTNKKDLKVKLEKTNIVFITSIPTEECANSVNLRVSNTTGPLEASSNIEDVVYVIDSNASGEETEVKKENFTADDEGENFHFDSDEDSNHYIKSQTLDVKIEQNKPKKENTIIKKAATKRKAKNIVSEPKTKKARVRRKHRKVEENAQGEKKVGGRISEDSAKCELDKETDPNRKTAILFYTYYCGKKSSYAHIYRKMEILDKFSKTYNVDVNFLSKEEQIANFNKHRNDYCNMPYICEVCGRGYSMEDVYKNHLVVHEPSSGEFECDVCKMHFKSGCIRDAHITAVHLKRFTCRQCGYVTKDTRFAKKHFARHVGNNFTCDHCWKEFTQGPSFKKHLRIAHNVVTSKKQPCVICFDVFRGLIDLKEHRSLVHPQAVTCGSCNIQLHNQKSLDTHFEDSTEKVCKPNISPCPMCGDSFPSEKMMREHHEQLHQKLKCNKCDKTFLSKTARWAHSREHKRATQIPTVTAGPKDLICEVCGKGTFKTVTLLSEHQRMHTGEKPHKCTECGKAFRLNQMLRKHMLTHTDERRYKCSLCPKAFHQHAHRSTHMLTHTKERPFYTCTACPKKYTAQQTLKEHIDTAHRGLPARKRVKNPGFSKKQDLISFK